MAFQKPSIPKGTRDFSPIETVRRNFIFDTIKRVYQKFGFQQIETPAMEMLSTLEGKYGEEGDKLLFRIINSGDPFKDLSVEELISLIYRKDDLAKDIIKDKALDINKKYSDEESEKLVREKLSLEARKMTEKGLRYDLTVPFARYVVMHQNEITFPFKRYQMQPVWRADRPQKGRYREFYQCDADVIGSTSLLNEVELIQIIHEVFGKLGVGFVIKINNRKILAGIAEIIGEPNRMIDIAIAIDKIDKIGITSVIQELREKGFSNESLNKLLPFLTIDHSIEKLMAMIGSNIMKEGINELFTIYNYLAELKINLENIQMDVSLARGLEYYTGTIIEVKVNDSRSIFTNSICGGGRYDDLTGIFGLPNVSGVGISFGVDRIYDVMEEMKLFDELKLSGATTKILFVNFGNEEEKYCLDLLKQIRDAGINSEIYPDAAKMKKQMGYADDNKIPFVCLVGSDEMKSGQLTLKNMTSGEQEKLTISEMIDKLIN